MSNLSHLTTVTHEDLEGVTIFPLEEELAPRAPQEVLVDVAPNATIPLHTHTVDATMIILSGGGLVLSERPDLNGKSVKQGDVVFFKCDEAHGFRAGSLGLVFLSRNGGIVAPRGTDWDITFLRN